MPDCHNFPFLSAADVELVFTPPGTVSCDNVESLRNWMNVVTTNFQTLACMMEEFLGIEVEVPGISGDMIPPADPGLIPGWPGFELQLRARGGGARGRVGNVFPIRLGQDPPSFHLKGEGLPDIQFPGLPGLPIPGSDPIKAVIELIDISFEIIQKALADAGIKIDLPPTIVTGDPCDMLDADTVGPGLGIVQQTNQKLGDLLETVRENAAPCPQPFIDATLTADDEVAGCYVLNDNLATGAIMSAAFTRSPQAVSLSGMARLPHQGMAVEILPDATDGTGTCGCPALLGYTVNASVDYVVASTGSGINPEVTLLITHHVVGETQFSNRRRIDSHRPPSQAGGTLSGSLVIDAAGIDAIGPCLRIFSGSTPFPSPILPFEATFSNLRVTVTPP